MLLARSVERLSAESLLAEMNGNRDRITVERRLNSVDLRNELATTDRDAPLLLSLALRAKEGWAGALERRFPLRKFVVQLFGENDPDVSLRLTFWETR